MFNKIEFSFYVKLFTYFQEQLDKKPVHKQPIKC